MWGECEARSDPSSRLQRVRREHVRLSSCGEFRLKSPPAKRLQVPALFNQAKEGVSFVVFDPHSRSLSSLKPYIPVIRESKTDCARLGCSRACSQILAHDRPRERMANGEASNGSPYPLLLIESHSTRFLPSSRTLAAPLAWLPRIRRQHLLR